VNDLPSGYLWRAGSGLDRALLVKFMQKTYQELYPGCNFAHLAQTVEQYLSPETPLWWVDQRVEVTKPQSENSEHSPVQNSLSQTSLTPKPIACLWLGNAVGQIWGDRQAYIFLLYVSPAHRRCGIGSALMAEAEQWAKNRGDRQIGLQVFYHNQPALKLYEKLGYAPQSVWMAKPLRAENEATSS